MKENKINKKTWYKTWWGVSLIIIFSLIVWGAVLSEEPTSSPENQTSKKSSGNKENRQTQPEDPAELNVAVSHDNLNVIITNKESKDLGDCKLKLNNDYLYDATNTYLVKAKQTTRIGLSEFTESDGTRFNVHLIKPQYLRIDCDRKQGSRGSADIFWD